MTRLALSASVQLKRPVLPVVRPSRTIPCRNWTFGTVAVALGRAAEASQAVCHPAPETREPRQRHGVRGIISVEHQHPAAHSPEHEGGIQPAGPPPTMIAS